MTGQELLAPARSDCLYLRPMELKDWIKAARKHAGLTGERLGELLGRTKGNVSGWENGLHEPSFSQVVQISTITGFSLRPLLGSIDTPDLRQSSAALPEALERLGQALAHEMPDDIRQDAADLLAKLAQRRGAMRHQQELVALLNGAAQSGKRKAA